MVRSRFSRLSCALILGVGLIACDSGRAPRGRGGSGGGGGGGGGGGSSAADGGSGTMNPSGPVRVEIDDLVDYCIRDTACRSYGDLADCLHQNTYWAALATTLPAPPPRLACYARSRATTSCDDFCGRLRSPGPSLYPCEQGPRCEGDMLVHCPAGRRFNRDCSTDNLMCLTNSSSRAVCGIGPCNDDGSGDDESDTSCSGTRRTRCSQRVEVTGTDCADRGLSCVQSTAAEPQRSGCGARYTGCSASECRGSEMVYCEDGAETLVDCRRIDSRLGSCVLAQTGGGDPVPSCAVAAAERSCMQGDDFCDGDVAHVCAGGLRYEMDCATFSARTSTLAGASSVTARCVEVGGGRGVRCDLGD